MKNIFKIAGAATVALALTQTIQAVPITGGLNFVGQAQLNSSSVNTATAETAWTSPITTAADSGTFALYIPSAPPALSGMAVSMANYTWNFNTPSAAVNGFWSVGGFSFELLSSHIVSQGSGFLSVSALGLVTGNGYDATMMQWNFSAQDPGQLNSGNLVFSWSASTVGVPDGASTVMLLGIALSGVALLKRKLSA